MLLPMPLLLGLLGLVAAKSVVYFKEQFLDGDRFEPFSNKDQTLVVQFTVKHEQNIDCGGGYVKLFPDSLDQTEMHGDSEYNIMFGPDIYGPGTKKVHVIFNYKGKTCSSTRTSFASNIYAYENFAILGLDLWQVKSGTIFDNFLITNDEAYAKEFGNKTWGVTKAAEKQMKDKQDEEQRLKEEEEADKDDDKDKDEDEKDEVDKE
ncbi:hypothetical protein QTO34_015163 [Cnephaeus nilssonii]|uniref:CRP55 n=1 Tax=Cnephaeus nilssonii TaxID=3371016 RepID=A0AA40I3L1_CNENI|nr:hypothetical protein QTO34_015163 [Eptesicus nilssonii]